jgi:4-hydroxybenzoate polyprenyltransferase
VCVLLSACGGRRSAAVHLALGVGAAHAYNLWLKNTAFSWLPYASAFGALPAVVTLAGPDRAWPPAHVVLAGAGLGVGAHLLNALPDLAEDAATGVRGLPHRLGPERSRALGAALLGLSTAATVLGTPRPLSVATAGPLAAAAGLVTVAVRGRGRAPFVATMVLAVLDVLLLVEATR